MDRRMFLKTAALGAISTGFTVSAASAEVFYPVKVDPALFAAINRVKDPAKKTPQEKTHAPVISAPAMVKAGEPFTIEVSVGENLHAMGPNHWIEYINLAIGNESVGRIDMQNKGYTKPKVSFTVVIPKEMAPAGKVTMVASERCNLHGYWESTFDITVG
jgi:superoxide reductase